MAKQGSLWHDIPTGVLYREDNLVQLADFPDQCVDLIYLDPPFFSNRVYEVIWGDEAEMRSFGDRWAGGIQNYVEWMRERVVQLHRVLKPTGSFYLHCDPHASGYLRVMLDDVFGFERFRSEVTWRRTNAHNDAKRWSPVTDTIFYYGKTDVVTWNVPYEPHSEEYLQSKYRNADQDGRRYQLDNMTSPQLRPNMIYEWKGHAPPPNGWRYSRETMAKLDGEGRIWYPKSKSQRPRLKRYLDEMSGTVVTNLWADISPINSQARERLGWPTQKPQALLERIIAASSNRDDIVLDPFCGCGTTVAAAERLHRRWIGIDISATAMEVMRVRLAKQGVGVTIENAPDSVPALKELRPFEFQNWVINSVHGSHSPRKIGDMGIDGYWYLTRDPIQVKQSEHVGRNVIDNFETALRRAHSCAGYVVAFSFTKGAVEEVARARRDEGIDIRLVRVPELLMAVKGAMNFSQKLGPQPATIAELPVPAVRSRTDKPSAADLIASLRASGG